MFQVEAYEHKGVPVEIYYDDHAENPYTSFDQASGLLNAEFGDDIPVPGYRSWSEPDVATMTRWLTLFGGYVVAIPFQLNDYGSNGWQAYLTDADDDRAKGYLVVSRETFEAEGWATVEEAEKCARAEFETFKQYLSGDVYGYVVAGGREDEDACWGFYGMEYVKEAAEEAAEYIADERANKRSLPWLPTFGKVPAKQ